MFFPNKPIHLRQFTKNKKMYTLYDYLHNGLLYLNNAFRPRHKKLSQLMIYATSICQSRCKHCSIWQREPESLSVDDIKRIVSSRCVGKNTVVGLEGGEFVLHPEAEAIMKWLSENHPKYTLLSNCLTPNKVIDAVRNYHPSHLFVSLDGNRETYERMRGRDGYDKVIQVVETLKDEIPISLMFCLSPWNDFSDMEFVINVAKKYNIDVRIGMYSTIDFFNTTQGLLDADDFVKRIPQNIHDTQENYDYVALYEQWRRGNLKLRCQSIKSSLVIHSNGNVPICQNLDVVLGNIHKQSLDEIFNGKPSCNLQCKYDKECNACWINFHRKYDVILLRNFERFLPKWLIEKFYGKYQWTDDKRQTYAGYLKSVKK